MSLPKDIAKVFNDLYPDPNPPARRHLKRHADTPIPVEVAVAKLANCRLASRPSDVLALLKDTSLPPNALGHLKNLVALSQTKHDSRQLMTDEEKRILAAINQKAGVPACRIRRCPNCK